MVDVLKNLKANLEGDPVAIMSKARVKETIAEIELLRGLLQEALPFVSDRIGVPTLDLQIRIKNALKGIK